MTGSRVVLFRSRRTRRDVTDLSTRLDLRVVEMPVGHESLSELFRDALS